MFESVFEYLWLVPGFPLLGFVVLAFHGRGCSKGVASVLGCGSVGLSALTAGVIAAKFLAAPPADGVFRETLWVWMDVAGFQPTFGLHLDALSLVMMLVITFVGFLIHVYSSGYMAEDPDYARFFAYMNLFMAAMLILVLGDNLLMLYLGWEGVGLCSYLLIGFWYTVPANAKAAVKAFVVTRVGDTAFAVGLFLLINELGGLDIEYILKQAPLTWTAGSSTAVLAAFLLLAGAVGKSAQLPLQVWLPDAMAGPTPVSALIHAATMVTAGVYLIARMNALFILAPVAQTAVAVIGAVTLLTAGFSALVQSDIKRALAYSTMSQVGYMFLALGVGAWSSALFHFATHAFFKALLFLAAGAVILSVHHEQNMFKMGGLRSRIPFIFSVFLVGSASLAALPMLTDGFYSKDLILWGAWASPLGGKWFWLAGFIGAFITALYSFRMLFLVFWGPIKTEAQDVCGLAMKIPLGILAVCCFALGFIERPDIFAHVHYFTDFIRQTLPDVPMKGTHHTELMLMTMAGAASLAGICVAYALYVRAPKAPARLIAYPPGAALHRFWFIGWGFDVLYSVIFIRPMMWAAKNGRQDIVDVLYQFIAKAARSTHKALSGTQTGMVRNYAAGIAIGAVLLIAFLVMS